MLRVKPTSWGQTVRAERNRRHLSQKEAADELNVSERTLQSWEIGDVTPWPRHRRAIVAWLEQEEAA